jgi:hypothetical protein
MDRIEIVTEMAMSMEDTNEGLWAGFLIGGEMRWVENYDVLGKKPFPDHQPLIICHASEFSDAPPAHDAIFPVRP